MPDPHFANPRLAALYDHIEADRDDLDHYVKIIDELGARSVLDVGCGTGTLACLLAARGMDVTAVDPAAASVEIARRKPGGDLVRWIDGDATGLPPLTVDLATMTGNVAQVFVTDEAWRATLAGVRATLGIGGHLVFETRDPAQRAWEGWNRDNSLRTVLVDGIGPVTVWHELTDVTPSLVSFRTTYRFEDGGDVLTSDSTLCFRTADELRASLEATGFDVVEVRDAPDRPAKELVFIARADGEARR